MYEKILLKTDLNLRGDYSAKNGKGMAKLYKDFGDIHSEKYDGYLGF